MFNSDSEFFKLGIFDFMSEKQNKTHLTKNKNRDIILLIIFKDLIMRHEMINTLFSG